MKKVQKSNKNKLPDYNFGVSKADITRYKQQAHGTWKGGKVLA